MRNLTLRYDQGLDQYISYGKNSRFVALSTEAVFHEKLVTIEPVKPVVVPAPATPPVSYTLSIQCDIGRPNIIFPADSHDINSRLLVISLGLDLTYLYRFDGYITTRYHIHKLKAFVEQPTPVHIKVAPILEPVDFVLEMEHLKEGSNTRLSIQGDIKVRLAYGDITMINAIIRSFSTPPSTEKEIELALQSSGSEGFDDDDIEDEFTPDTDSFVDVSSSSNTNRRASISKETKQVNWDRSGQFDLGNEYDDDQVKTEIEIPEAGPTLPTKYELDTSIKQKFVFLFVNDSHGYDQPLQKVVIKDFHLLDCVWKNHEWNVKSIITASASYYNMKVADWEPILEQFGVQIDYERKRMKHEFMDKWLIGNIEDQYLQDYKLGKYEVMNLNISLPMIQSVVLTNRIISGKQPQSVSAQFHPYTLRNHCGYDVELTLHANMDDVINTMVEGHLPIDDIRQVVPCDTEYGFDAPERAIQTLTHSSLLTSMKRTWEKTFPVTVSIPHMNTRKLIDAQKTGRIVIQKGDKIGIIEVELLDGRRYITIRSCIKVVNKSTVTWQLAAVVGKTMIEFATLQPGESCGVPIVNVQNGTLVARPEGANHKYVKFFMH